MQKIWLQAILLCLPFTGHNFSGNKAIQPPLTFSWLAHIKTDILSVPLGQKHKPAVSATDTATLKQSNWYREALHTIEQSEYHIHYQEDFHAFSAPNRSQNLRSAFTGNRFTLQPRNDSADKWKLELTTTGIFSDDVLLYAPAAQAVTTQNGNSIRFDHNQNFITEYINSKEGVRQNFIIEKEPASKPSQLSVRLQASKGWFINKVSPTEIHFAKATRQALDKKITYNDLQVWDAQNKKLEAAFEVKGNEIAINVNTKNAVYPITIDPLSTTANWTGESNQASALLGISVASAGDVNGDGYSDVIVGASAYDNGQTDEGAAFVYHGSATGLSSTPAQVLDANQGLAAYGICVSTAGDVNNDGYSDVIVCAYLFSNGESNEGRVFVYHGSATGVTNTAAWTAEGNQAGASFGNSAACAGDVNGDGYSDVIVGAPGYDNGQTNEGMVFVYHGSASGLLATASWTAERNQASAFFGASVASAGDVNGDGYSDVIVGAYLYDNGQTDEGAAFVYHGSATGLATSAAWTAESNQASAGFGISVASAGDVNGDGYGDVILGAYLYDNGQTDEGAAFVYQGSSTGLSTITAWSTEGNQPAAQYGYSVASAGDVNGDGYADVIAGAPNYDNGQTNEGRVYAYAGSASGLSATPFWTAESNQTSAFMGISAASAGDVNGDGYSDVIAGAYSYDNGQTDEGAAFVYHGSATGLSASSSWTAESNVASTGLGSSVACAGDVNGDGYSDVIIGASNYSNGETTEGAAYLYYGTATGLAASPAWQKEGNQDFAAFGSSVAGAGDVNGDGYSDIIIGASNYSNGQISEGKVFLYYGSAAGPSASPDWTVESNQDNALMGSSVASAGDVNGDGYSDIILSAPQYSNGESGEGMVYVYYGSATGPAAAPNWTAEGNQVDALLGGCVAGAGDVNGDGYSDVIIGAIGYDNVITDRGKVYVYHGSSTGLPASPNWTVEGEVTLADFGGSVATAGDVNGDGYSDVVIGAALYTNGQANEGKTYLFYGSATGLPATPNWTQESNQANTWYGYKVASAGDVNGDGYSDLLISATLYTNGQSNEGAAFLYYGSSAGLAATAAWTGESNQVLARYANSLTGAGDVNGDGFSDILIGAKDYDNGQTDEGVVFAYYGNAGTPKRSNLRLYNTDLVTPIQRNNYNSPNIFGAGLYAKSPLGRAKGKLVWEVKQQGQAFSGSPITNSTTYYDKQTFFTDMGLTGTELKSNVQKRGKQTKIRARVEYSKATAITGQVYGPWRYPPGYTLGAYGMNSTPLPLTLIAFSGNYVNDAATALEWITANEFNVDHFIIERSYDGIRFTAIASQPATGSNGNRAEYHYSDNPVNGSKVFYRLKIVEKDGVLSGTRIITLTHNSKLKIYLAANPLTRGQNASLVLEGKSAAETISISVSDALGRTMRTQSQPLPSNGGTLKLATTDLPAGIYYLQIHAGDYVKTEKLVIR